MPEQENSIVDLKKYLGTEENPVANQEFKDFWESLEPDEKMEFKQTKLD